MNNIFLSHQLNLKDDECIAYGSDKQKIKLKAMKRLKNKPDGKLILVTAINPTPAGEGKTTISIGLAQGLKYIGEKPILTLREPSLGPVFGLKGGATGGGKSLVVPAQDINLHFTGDMHAITSANNLLSALIDNHVFHGNELDLDVITWKRCMDMNDRSLRKIETSPRKDGFIITAASEIMAILALSRDINDLKTRINRILIGYDKKRVPIYVSDLGGADAMALLLKNAINPNLVQTIDGVPAFIHAGPFANIAHGCNSIVATKLALKLGDYTITEAGFGADLGMEKFLNLKMPHLDKQVDAVVIVITLRALKSHGGEQNYNDENIEALSAGMTHLTKHLENIRLFGLNYVIALNHFYNDTKKEINYLLKWSKDNNHRIAVCKGFEKGGAGMIELAQIVKDISNQKSSYIKLYDPKDSPETKIEKIAKNIYGAEKVRFTKKATEQLAFYKSLEWNLPVCIAKTPLSLSGDAKAVGVPKNFTLTIKEIRPSLGAGFLVALTKGIMVMPGLNKTPRALDMLIDDDGNLIQ